MENTKVGDKVICNGYTGTITRLCEWSNSMVEVRLNSGLVCVDESELILLGVKKGV